MIDFHLDFALGEPDLIRIQDRDLAYLPAAAERQVRRAQRLYVEVWVGVLRELEPGLAETDARLMAHAVFGLLNSTPHSLKPADGERSAVACGDAGDDCGRLDRRRFAVVAHLLNPAIN